MTSTGSQGRKPPWRESNVRQFDATVLAAAESLDVQPLAVEKDYWVCRALRAIEERRPNEVVFKGGTSLEKLRIIQHFSEDLDLLLVSDLPKLKDAKRVMKDLCEVAAQDLQGELTDRKSGGIDSAATHKAYVNPPLVHTEEESTALAENRRILLEFGQAGSDNPSERRLVESLLAQTLRSGDGSVEVDTFWDLEQFDTRILHPGRTLLEKLLRVNNFAVRADDDEHGWPRIGRQFYDLWALLGSAEVLAFLEDRTRVRRIYDDCRRVSIGYRSDEEVPSGGFASCTLFDPTWPWAERLRAEHDVAMRDLYYGDAELAPTFDDVVERIQEHRELLVIVA